MPQSAPRFCSVPGCSRLASGRRCLEHAVAAEQARPNYEVRRWYRTARWRALRSTVLRAAAYVCAECHRVAAALEVDHVVKHGGDPRLFWALPNLQALCRGCHQRKTQRGE